MLRSVKSSPGGPGSSALQPTCQTSRSHKHFLSVSCLRTQFEASGLTDVVSLIPACSIPAESAAWFNIAPLNMDAHTSGHMKRHHCDFSEITVILAGYASSNRPLTFTPRAFAIISSNGERCERVRAGVRAGSYQAKCAAQAGLGRK